MTITSGLRGLQIALMAVRLEDPMTIGLAKRTLPIMVLIGVGASCGGNSPTSPSSGGSTSSSSTFVSFSSPAGEFIGQGTSRRFTPSDTTFKGKMVDSNRRLEIRLLNGADAWFVDMAAPPAQQLKVGSYTNLPPAPADAAMFQFSGGGHGCTVGASDVNVLEASFGTPPPGSSPLITGIISRFHATFTQRCGVNALPLTGEISVNALTPNR